MLFSNIQENHKAIYPILLIIAVIWTPLFFFTDIRLAGQLMFESVAVIALAVAISIYVNLWIGGFFLLSCVSAIFPFKTVESMESFNYIICGIVWFSVLVLCCKNVSWLMDAICIVCLINILWIILQMIGIDPLFIVTKPWADRSGNVLRTGFLSNPNETSALIAFSVICFLRKGWKYFLPILAFGLVVTITSGNIIAVLAGFLFYLFIKYPVIISKVWSRSEMVMSFILCSSVVFFVYFLFVDVPSFHRLEAWSRGWGLYKNHWIMGYGIGHWKVIFGKYFEMGVFKYWWNHAHNDILQATVEMGILFPIILMGYFINIARRFTKESLLEVTGVVIITACSSVSYTFHIPQTAIIIITLMAITEITLRNNPKVKKGELKCQKIL